MEASHDVMALGDGENDLEMLRLVSGKLGVTSGKLGVTSGEWEAGCDE